MVPKIEVKSTRGVLAASYQFAASLSSCIVSRSDDALGQTTGQFSARLVKKNDFWVSHPSDLILVMDKAFWWWKIRTIRVSSEEITGMIEGDPKVTLWIPSSLSEGL